MTETASRSLLLAAILLVSCTAVPTEPIAPSVPPPVPSATPAASPEEAVAARALEVVLALRDRDLAALSSYVHPTEGVRFSPYASVRDTDLVFMPDRIGTLLADPAVYVWGAYDGTGLPIELTFAQYIDRFVYDQDFANAEETGINRTIGVGNSINNCFEFYSGATVVEFHFSGFDPDLGGMDWRSLRLVFREEGQVWYLVGVIHDEWTI